MIVPPEGRWPPVYDADGLAREIRALAAAPDFEARFWDMRTTTSTCQGDVVELEAPLPFLDEEGIASATAEDFRYWLVLGNTCDFTRDLALCEWTQMVPLLDVSTDAEDHLQNYRSYKAARKFYVPPWPGSKLHHLADLTRPVTVHKSALDDCAQMVGRLQRASWALLHSCLIRFLCRDDGRFG